MHTREFRVLDGEDDAVVRKLAAGVGRDAARILAYLLLRADHEDDPATNVELQVGTRLNRTAVADAIARLETDDLVDRTSVRGTDRGRSLTAWRPVGDLETTARRAYARHAAVLLDRSARIADEVGEVDGTVDASTDRLALALNWRPNGLHVPVYTASAAGWYEAYDVDVRVDHYRGSRRALDQVRSGAADVGVAGAATVIRARAADEPVVPIAVLYQRAMTVLYTVREVFGEPLRSVEQLDGRRVGMPRSSETRILGRLFLSQTTADDVRIVDTVGEEREALLTGDADVVTGSFADPLHLDQRDMTVDTLLLTDHFPIYGPVVIVHEGTLADRTAELGGFLAGTTGGWADALEDPAPAVERIAAAGDDSPDRVRRTFRRAAETFGGSDDVRDHGWGWQHPEMWERLRTALEQARLLEERS